jgi:hypothetical protein
VKRRSGWEARFAARDFANDAIAEFSSPLLASGKQAANNAANNANVCRLQRSPYHTGPGLVEDLASAKLAANTAPRTSQVVCALRLFLIPTALDVFPARLARAKVYLHQRSSIRANLTADAVRIGDVGHENVCAHGRTWFQVAGRCRSGADQRAPGKKSAFDFHICDSL